MCEIIRRQSEAMGARQVMNVRAGLAKLISFLKGRPLKIGTGCSGTDMPLICMDRLVAFWKDTFGLTLDIEHTFSCENVDFKQEFILGTCRPKVLGIRKRKSLGFSTESLGFSLWLHIYIGTLSLSIRKLMEEIIIVYPESWKASSLI